MILLLRIVNNKSEKYFDNYQDDLYEAIIKFSSNWEPSLPIK